MRDFIDAALEVYSARSKTLRFPAYFKQLRRYLHRLSRCDGKMRKAAGAQAVELQYEKVCTKVICALMNGFAAQGLMPDQAVEQESSDSDASSSGSEGENAPAEEAEAGQNEDVEMDEGQVATIQAKMLKSVLPVLSRHLTDEGTRSKSLDDAKTVANDSKHFRGFAVVCYAKAIRQLEQSVFLRHLRKLVNMIVV
jgi:hypothetical protein